MNFYNKFNKLKMKYKNRPSKLIVTIFGLFALICLGVGTSYAYLTYFSEAEGSTGISAGTLAIEFTEESGAIVMDKAVPQLESDALANNKEYKFSLRNTGSLGVTYTLYFNNICQTSSSYVVGDASITPSKCIPFQYINVAIKKGDNEYKTYNLGKYKDSNRATLDLGNIEPQTTSEEYSLKIWLDYDTPNDYSGYDASGNIRNVIFAGQISVYGEQVTSFENYTKESCFTVDNEWIMGYDITCGKDVVIPPIIDGQIRSRIDTSAFYDKKITSVVIPETITTINSDAFWGNNLTCVSLPSSITTIENNAFEKSANSNPNLTSIINNSTNAFMWDKIINANQISTNYNFVSGTVPNSVAPVIISPAGNTCHTAPSVDLAFASITMTSNNATETHAKSGNVITVNMITNEAISTPTVTIAGSNATVTKVSNTNYKATLTVGASTMNGAAKLSISGWNYANGTAGTTINKVTSGGYPYIDTTSPSCKIAGPFVSETNQTPKTSIKKGEDVYYTLSCTDAGGIATIGETSNITKSSSVANIRLSSITNITNGYKYTLRATASQTTGNGTLTIPAGWVKDIAGNTSTAIIATKFTVTQ